MFDAVAIGEVLIDFSPAGLSQAGNTLFEMNPGGAPANVLATLGKLGKKTAFIGKVGQDQFGEFLKETLIKSGINVSGLVFAKDVNTTLAFVHLNEKGDRSFSFYRNPGADMALSVEDIKFDLVENARIFHFGSVSLTDEPSRTATIKAAGIAKEKGLIISYDPNLRPPLWKSLDEARKMICQGLYYADILKLSEDELEFITGSSSLETASKDIMDKYGINMIYVTLGKKGCFYRWKESTGIAPAYDFRTIDTTGAGDAFLGGILYQILEAGKDINQLTTEEVSSFVDFANAVGSLSTIKKGAIPAIPTLDEIIYCMKNTQKLMV